MCSSDFLSVNEVRLLLQQQTFPHSKQAELQVSLLEFM